MTDYFSRISYLMLEVNSGCNLACGSCNRKELEAQGFRAQKNMSQQELSFILDQLRSCPIDTIKLEGLSEPMLHAGFDELAAAVRERFPKAFVIIATNLQYNLVKTPFLKTIPHVDMVYLSIDGTGRIYEGLRSGASSEKLSRSLDAIKAHVPEEDRRKKLFVNFTLCAENYRELPKIYELKETYGLAGVRINLAQEWDEARLNERRFSDEIIEFLRPYRQDVKGVGGWEYRDCFWPFSGVVIDVFGDVRQCVINTSMKPVGNVFKDPLKKIFNEAPYYQLLRERLDANIAAEGCRTCDYKHLSPVLEKILGGKHALNSPRRKPDVESA